MQRPAPSIAESGFDALRAVHFQVRDPGVRWRKDEAIAIDAERPGPARKMLTPNVLRLRDGTYRMYFTASTPQRSGQPTSGPILSAISTDAVKWNIEPGERVGPEAAHGAVRVLAPDVIPLPAGGYRMYFQAVRTDGRAEVLSAISADGLRWDVEPGVRFGAAGVTYGTPRCIYIEPPADASAPGAWVRLYCHHYPLPLRTGLDAGNHVVSAVSADGLHFEAERGVRVPQRGPLQDYCVYAVEIIRLGDGSYRMYYGGWAAQPLTGRIFTATSRDGLQWESQPEPCLDLGTGHDARHVSEPCVIDLPDGRHRLFYEACDAQQQWRILGATSA